MPTSIALFRKLALSLPEATEGSHMGSPDFRLNNRIFATLAAQAEGRGMVKLTLEQQAAFIADQPRIFVPVPGGWGRMGMTHILLAHADEATLNGTHHRLSQRGSKTESRQAQAHSLKIKTYTLPLQSIYREHISV